MRAKLIALVVILAASAGVLVPQSSTADGTVRVALPHTTSTSCPLLPGALIKR